MRDIPDPCADLCLRNRSIQAGLGILQQLSDLRLYLADGEGIAGIAVPALIAGAEINADDIALIDSSAAGDAVDDFLIDRYTRAAGKPVKTEKIRNTAV